MNLDHFKIVAKTYLSQANAKDLKSKSKKIRRNTVSEQFKGIGITQGLGNKIAERYGTPSEYIGEGSIIKGLVRTKAIEPTAQKKHTKADKIAAILAAKKRVEKIAMNGIEVSHILLSKSAKKERINKRIANIAKNRAMNEAIEVYKNLIF